MRLGLMIGTALALVGCAAADGAIGDGDYMDDDLPMGNCSGAEGGSGVACPQDSGNVPIGFPCGGTQECAGDLTCVAPFADDEVGEFVCTAQCVPNADEAWWCIDAAACCDPNATCTPRGLCIVGDVSDDTAGDTTLGSSDGADSSGGSAGSGSDSSGGSSSDGGDSSDGSAGDGSSTSTGGN